MKRARLAAGVLPGVALLGVTGCSPSSSAPQGVAQQFVRAVVQHDGATACSLLTPQAAKSAGGAAQVPCPQAVLHVDEHGASVSSVQVFGDAAIVHIGSDTVFLRRMPNGWRVSAAGCTKQPDAPYDCDLEA
jgi:hypothetical protein